MFYEEKVIDGELMYRTAPDGQWLYVPRHVITDRMLRAEEALEYLTRRVDELIQQLVSHKQIGTLQ